MGRQVRRVALDFRWPMSIPYEGFLMPAAMKPTKCRECDGRGWSPESRRMDGRWWGNVPFDPRETGSEPFTIDTPGMIEYVRRKIVDSRAFYDEYLGSTGEETVRREAQRLCDLYNGKWQHHLSQEDVDAVLASGEVLGGLTHVYCGETRTWTKIDREPPTQREMNVWSLGMQYGLASVPEYVVQTAYAERHGVTMTCSTCDGEGARFRDDEHQQAYEDWKRTDPPAGDGWQMWETTSEGSPISPVFGSAEELARYMADAEAWGEDAMGYQGWLAFVAGPGWSPSGIDVGFGLQPGVMAQTMGSGR